MVKYKYIMNSLNVKPVFIAATLSVFLTAIIVIAVFSQANRSIFEKYVLGRTSTASLNLSINKDGTFEQQLGYFFKSDKMSGDYKVESDSKDSTVLKISNLKFKNTEDEGRFLKLPTHIKIEHKKDRSVAVFLSNGVTATYETEPTYVYTEGRTITPKISFGNSYFYHNKEKFELRSLLP